jgi:hypothetical protein
MGVFIAKPELGRPETDLPACRDSRLAPRPPAQLHRARAGRVCPSRSGEDPRHGGDGVGRALYCAAVDPEVPSNRTATRRRRLTLCTVCAALNGLLAAGSLALFLAKGPPDGEPRVLAILPPVLLLTFLILLVACYAMHLDMVKGQDEGQDDEDGPGDGGGGEDEDPSSGGGLDIDWQRFEAEFRAYEQRLRVPELGPGPPGHPKSAARRSAARAQAACKASP